MNLNNLTVAARRKPAQSFFLAVGAVALCAWAWREWASTISTDDAFLDGRVVQVGSSIPGRALVVHVADNERVEAGAVLVDLDPADVEARLSAARADAKVAEAALASAHAKLQAERRTTDAALQKAHAVVEAAEARVVEAQAGEVAARTQADLARSDVARLSGLDGRAVSEQQRDGIQATSRAANARVDAAAKNIAAAKAAVGAARGDLAAAEAAPEQLAVFAAEETRAAAVLDKARAAVRLAELDLEHTHVVAHEPGRVTRKTVQAGNYVQAGQILMALVPDDLWVVANFKETQLEELRPGAKVDLRVDAFPGARFAGHVDSIQAGSGSRFSMLPPENATGNFVKVVQRVPVKIVFDEAPDLSVYALGPGMSVEPVVHVR